MDASWYACRVAGTRCGSRRKGSSRSRRWSRLQTAIRRSSTSISPRRSADLRARRGALGFVLALALVSCGERDTPSPLAQLVSAQGTVSVQRAQKVIPGAAGAPLFSGDLIFTGAQSSARVRYRDGQEVDVSESTRFRIEEGLGKLTLTLEEGVVLSRAPSGGGAGKAG